LDSPEWRYRVMAIKDRGFGSMDKEVHKQIARDGGNACAKSPKRHKFTSETAKIAGKKGGEARKNKVYKNVLKVKNTDPGPDTLVP
jgi:general stress protein YciG